MLPFGNTGAAFGRARGLDIEKIWDPEGNFY